MRIFVGNLPIKTCETSLSRLFQQYGHVSSARIVLDPKTQRSRGFGFVSMPSLDDADEAIRHLSGATHGGRRLTVNEARDLRAGSKTGHPEDSARHTALKLFEALRD
jgi:RNA recognition motif-containing protein